MTFVDANFVLRAVVGPTSATDRAYETAMELFRAVARGALVITTSEAVLAEVLFVLTSKRQYGLDPTEATARLRPILALPGFVLARGRKHLYLRAFDHWTQRPALGFVDALTIATVEQTGMPLATFDAHFDGFPGISRYVPTEPS